MISMSSDWMRWWKATVGAWMVLLYPMRTMRVVLRLVCQVVVLELLDVVLAPEMLVGEPKAAQLTPRPQCPGSGPNIKAYPLLIDAGLAKIGLARPPLVVHQLFLMALVVMNFLPPFIPLSTPFIPSTILPRLIMLRSGHRRTRGGCLEP